MTTADRTTDHLRPLDRPRSRPRSTAQTVRDQADELGISYEAARSRLRRQRAPSRPGPTGADRPGPTTVDRSAELVDELRSRVAFLERQSEHQAAALEREQLASAELRRLLLAEQQRRVARLADIVTTRTEAAENAPAATDSTSSPPRPWWALWRR
jgi:hypothetical protein